MERSFNFGEIALRNAISPCHQNYSWEHIILSGEIYDELSKNTDSRAFSIFISCTRRDICLKKPTSYVIL